jgi:hypothetical protein
VLQKVILSAILIAVVMIMLFAPAMAQQASSSTSSMSNNQSNATPTRICPTLDPTIKADPKNDCYRYQGEDSVGEPDKESNAYCGQTCVAMVIQYVRGQSIPISEIVRYVGKGRYQFTDVEDLKEALDNWQIESTNVTDMEAIRRAVQDRGHMVISVVDMSEIETEGSDYEKGGTDPREHCSKYISYDSGHWVVVHGITSDGQWVIVHDPDVFDGNPLYWYSDETPKGKTRYYLYSEFEDALDAISEDALEITGGSDPTIEVTLFEQPEFPILEPGEETEIYFALQNTGSEVWRAGHYALVNVNGVPLGACPQMALNVDVPSGEAVGWRFAATAPLLPGIYRTEWRFSYNGQLTGPLLWTDVIVVPGGGDDLAAVIRGMIEEARQDAENWIEEQWEELRRQIIEMIWAEICRRVREFFDKVCCGSAATIFLFLPVLWLSHRQSRVEEAVDDD